MVLPIKNYYLTGSILILLILDFLLLYNKNIFAFDLGMAGFLGIFQVPITISDQAVNILEERGFGITSTLLLMLFLVTLRLLNRHEIQRFYSKRVAFAGKCLVFGALACVAMLWQIPLSMPHPFSIEGDFITHPFQQDMKNISWALEQYAADNKGVYPGTLPELSPQ
jgi:hypothetical protein